MRIISGYINLPENCPVVTAARVLIEVRDTSLQDVSSTVVADKVLEHVSLGPSGRIAFDLQLEEFSSRIILSLRVHIDVLGNNTVQKGDLLTTRSYRVPPTGDASQFEIKVELI